MMKLCLDKKLAKKYKSPSQKARILTERWVDDSIFCPNCGHAGIDKYENNRPVADFYCKKCSEDYELKSKHGGLGQKIVDGAYRTMLARLTSINNPNFFILNYDVVDLEVVNFFVIPKHFFVPDIIEKRKPLAKTARRAGWTGCNILLNHVPQTGKIFFIRNRLVEPKESVLLKWQKTLFLREKREVIAKGWLLDIMRCIDKIGKKDFTLDDMYGFENELRQLYPDNKHIKDKIRQQLQLLRDKRYIEFVSRGCYRLV